MGIRDLALDAFAPIPAVHAYAWSHLAKAPPPWLKLKLPKHRKVSAEIVVSFFVS